MSRIRFVLTKALQRSLRRRGLNVHRITDAERQLFADLEAQQSRQELEVVFGDELGRLNELRRRYANVRLPVAVHSLWATGKPAGAVRDIGWGGVDLRVFRGSVAYVWDYVGANVLLARLQYFLFAEYVHRHDRHGLLERLEEDGAFGCVTFDFDRFGRISRDLLDSIIELEFLDKHLGVLARDDLRVLDIGAGYGRMAYRMLEANPQVASYTCVDAIPESTFLCEYYLRHRGLADRVDVVALDELDAELAEPRFDLALNVHSFSECTYTAIEWWLRRLADLQVRHLMIVPNHADGFRSMESDRSERDYAPLLAEVGYELVASQPVIDDADVQRLVDITDKLYLFELRRSDPDA